jgi:ribosome modulation factor
MIERILLRGDRTGLRVLCPYCWPERRQSWRWSL